jgi:hypothetical protein
MAVLTARKFLKEPGNLHCQETAPAAPEDGSSDLTSRLVLCVVTGFPAHWLLDFPAW